MSESLPRCAGPCARPLRPRNVPLSECPGTATVSAKGRCRPCRNAQRAAEYAAAPPSPETRRHRADLETFLAARRRRPRPVYKEVKFS